MVLFSPPSLSVTTLNGLLLFFITPYTAAHKYKKVKIHLKYDLKYKKDINTNTAAHAEPTHTQQSHGGRPRALRLLNNKHTNVVRALTDMVA